jgi:DNA repair exonuclease SbcCD nuclease subunit
MAVRFLHTADLQIGKLFGQFPSDVASKLRAARLDTLRRIANYAKTHALDGVLVAGDCFDDIGVSDETLRRFLAATGAYQGPWILLPGNHDPAIAESPWTRLRRLLLPPLPPNLIIADRAKPVRLGNNAFVLPAPLFRRADTSDVTEWFDTADTGEGMIRIGLAHGCVQGILPGESEAKNPISQDRVGRARLDYLALGDWHGRFQVSERAWYSGTPEPDRFRANDPGYALEVTIENSSRTPIVNSVPISTFAWVQCHLTISPGGADDITSNLNMSDNQLERVILDLHLHGTIDLATNSEIRERLDSLRARVVHLSEHDDELIIEPTPDDLDSIDLRGFVRVAANQLRDKISGPDAETARRALALLYGLHRRASG